MAPLAMFPLGSVLLPSSLLPLRLFEPRYLSLIEDVLAGEREFGVTLIERGHEVGGNDQRTNVGCMAQVLEAEEHEGLWNVIAVGTSRFTVDRWLEDDPYPKAEVTAIDEPAAVPQDAEPYAEARSKLTTVLALLSETGAQVGPTPELPDDPALGSFQIAGLAPLGPFDRQQLLSATSPTQRLELLGPLLDGLETDIRAQLSMG